ncbi:MAG: hypothetical protein HOY71_10150 [Nonomuraea sp.]|nr:hypothetical protein [Nonomuraea sp.]
MRLITLVSAAALALAALSPAASAAARPTLADCAGKPQVRPKQIILACADAGDVLHKLKWTSWSGRTARATGVESVNTCEPNCAAGHFVTHRVKVTLRGDGKRFTRIYVNGKRR